MIFPFHGIDSFPSMTRAQKEGQQKNVEFALCSWSDDCVHCGCGSTEELHDNRGGSIVAKKDE
jgi:hypothetical protein